MGRTRTAMLASKNQLRPIIDDDEVIRASLEHADISALMCTLVHLTGDMGVIRGDIRPKVEPLNPDDGLTEDQRSWVRDRAFDAIVAHRDDPQEFYVPDFDEIRELLNFLADEEVSDDYVEFLVEELGMHGEDPFSQPEIMDVPEDVRSEYKVLIIGAGMSGLLAAIRLQEASIGFEVIEKNPDVGGTWFENIYPGCRVDSSNHAYSYSFRPQDWPQFFSSQPILQQYFSDTSDEFGLTKHIRFNSEVTEARFDDTTGKWSITVKEENGFNVIEADAVISAVGQLNRPNMPDINGLEHYTGLSFHSAEWQHEHSLKGKRVGVIGSGASAFQFVPVIALEAAQVTVFQRTPPWVMQKEDYFKTVPDGKHWLLNHVPFYGKWYRFSVFWRMAEGLLSAVTAQDGWNRPEESVSEENQRLRDIMVAQINQQFGDRRDLAEKCTPDYPPGAKRALVDDGKYYQSLKRDNVALNTDGISEITENGLVTKTGEAHDFDVLIYATGFKASSFLFPMKIYGMDGRELHEAWDGDPTAYKGISIPGYPDFYCCYGPNTNIVINGSIIFFSECEVRYILGCIALLLKNNGKQLNVKQQVHDEYNRWIEAGTATMAWGQSNVSTWYKNEKGKITQNWPFSMLAFWQQTRRPDPDAYDIR